MVVAGALLTASLVINPGAGRASAVGNPGEESAIWKLLKGAAETAGLAERVDEAAHVASLPRAFPKIPWYATPALRARLTSEREAIFAERFADADFFTNEWMCAAAKVLEKSDAISPWVKQRAEAAAEKKLAAPAQAAGFVEQGAELGRFLVLKTWNAACDT
jgi:hypothetical protein